MSAKQSYVGMGKEDGQECKLALDKATGTMRKILEQRAPSMLDDMAKADWLKGFGEVMGDTKKSEAKAVFEAWAKDALGVTGFKGEFNAWVTKCREIRGAVRVSPAVQIVRAATPQAVQKATETIKKAKLADVLSLVDSGMAQVVQHTKEAWEPAIIGSIAKACEQLKKSKDKAYLELASDIIGCIEDFEDEREQVLASMVVEAAQLSPPAPTPAVAEVVLAA